MDLLHNYKDFLLNIFIILTPLVFYRHTIHANHWFRPWLVFILFAGPMILTMMFPIKAYGTVHDFRALPLIIGSLYGGGYTPIWLFATLILYRFSLGEVNIVNYTLALLPTFILVGILWRKYQALQFRNKVIVTIGMCFFLRITVMWIYFSLENQLVSPIKTIISSFPLIVTQSLLAGFFVYILEEVRKSIQLNAEVIKAEKIRIVSDIAASVAHEVRNPLTAVRGFIQLLGDPALGGDKRSQYSKICLEELDRAQLIISDYLSLAKPEHDVTESFDIVGEFQYITSILGSYANYQNVQIVNSIEENAFITGNRSKFRQAIINFGKNSIEAMPNGGVLEFRSAVTNQELELLVVDNGIGMTSEQVGRLGTPYYSTKEKGTGLGTMVSYNIIQKMQGRIEVESKLGIGTTYRITFPLTLEKQQILGSEMGGVSTNNGL